MELSKSIVIHCLHWLKLPCVNNIGSSNRSHRYHIQAVDTFIHDPKGPCNNWPGQTGDRQSDKQRQPAKTLIKFRTTPSTQSNGHNMQCLQGNRVHHAYVELNSLLCLWQWDEMDGWPKQNALKIATLRFSDRPACRRRQPPLVVSQVGQAVTRSALVKFKFAR